MAGLTPCLGLEFRFFFLSDRMRESPSVTLQGFRDCLRSWCMQIYCKIPHKYGEFLISWASVLGSVVLQREWNRENICENSCPHSMKSNIILVACLLKPPLHLQEHKIKCPLKPWVCSFSQPSKLTLGAWYVFIPRSHKLSARGHFLDTAFKRSRKKIREQMMDHRWGSAMCLLDLFLSL